jgi:hypothetical protein
VRRDESFCEFVGMLQTSATTAQCAAIKHERPVREFSCGSSAAD